MAQVHEFNVAMSCEGCSNAVNRVLSRQQDIKNIKFDMEKQKVYVETSMSGEDVLAIIKKTGRECSYVGVQK
ncbi:hypothetical protein EMCRGX_G033603 [Ephydatia muelleri]|eukprot:Em0022g658a